MRNEFLMADNKQVTRKGNWIETYTGIHFYPLDPREEEISIIDIAHALSLICRFNGHCKHFYSVAQHSVNVYKYLRERCPTDFNLQLAGLLHDASEAYISDVSRPVKSSLKGYLEIESNLMKVIFEAFDVPLGVHFEDADDLVLQAEAMRLMPGSWWTPNNLEIDVIDKPAIQVRHEFIKTYQSLVKARTGST